MLNYPEGGMITPYVQSLSVLIRKTGNRMYRGLGLSTAEWPILAMLARGEPLGISHICDRLGRDKGHVSRDIASLAKRGLVRKRRDATDGRQILIEFHPDAVEARQQFVQIMLDRSDQLTKGLSEQDLANLKRILLIMTRNVREMENSEESKSSSQ